MRTAELLMINPIGFAYNSETAVNNAFQVNTSRDVEDAALREFSTFVDLLRQNHLSVAVIDSPGADATPDAVFPNNWISFHEDNSVYLYPMFAANRRLERSDSILKMISDLFHVHRIHDLSQFETEEKYLEGTGSLVLDRRNKIAYAAISPRTTPDLVDHFCKIASYEPVCFHATDASGSAIYHTNVLMCVTDDIAIVCLESIYSADQRRLVQQKLLETGKVVLSISQHQMQNFCGNMLGVRSLSGENLLIMSTRAWQSLSKAQLAILESKNRIIHSSLDIIENCGGGSARCMIAEIFNERKKEPGVKTPGVVL